MHLARAAAPIFALAALACAPIALAGPGCSESAAAIVLPRELGETSGVAVGIRDPGVLWTHNDGSSALYALDQDGVVLQRFDLPVALEDWEDLEITTCLDGQPCLFLADTGDNGERRPAGDVRILRVTEPVVGMPSGPLPMDEFPVRYPDGPRDVEALFVLPGEVPYLVTKGGGDAISVYRYPPPLRADTVTLVEVQRLTNGSVPLLDRVTAASASPDGRWVGVRSYQALRFYRVEADTLAASDGGMVNLRSLQEIQGEGVGIGEDGVVVLTSEGGPLGGPPSMRRLRCRLSTP